jgi:hypothetical protein
MPHNQSSTKLNEHEYTEEVRLFKLHFVPESNSMQFRCADSKVFEKAMELLENDVKTSNFNVVLAAKVLFLRGALPAFSLVFDGKVCDIDQFGMFNNEPNNIYEILIDEFTKLQIDISST